MGKMTEIRIETYDEGTTMNVIRKKIEEIKFDCIDRPLRSGWRVVAAKFMIAPDPKDTKSVFVKSEVTTKIPGYISETTGRIKNNMIYFQPNLPECDEEAVDASPKDGVFEDEVFEALESAIDENEEDLKELFKKDGIEVSIEKVRNNPNIESVKVVHSA